MSTEPEWLAKARAEGRILSETGVRDGTFQGSARSDIDPPGANADHWEGMSEKEFQEKVIAFAQDNGWRVAHCRKVLVKMGERTHYETPMAADGAGYPDLTMVKKIDRDPWAGFRLIFAELKTNTGSVRPEQKQWLADLADIGPFETFAAIWRPKDWPEITRILRGE